MIAFTNVFAVVVVNMLLDTATLSVLPVLRVKVVVVPGMREQVVWHVTLVNTYQVANVGIAGQESTL
jgi:hypothetical protein